MHASVSVETKTKGTHDHVNCKPVLIVTLLQICSGTCLMLIFTCCECCINLTLLGVLLKLICHQSHTEISLTIYPRDSLTLNDRRVE